VSDDGSESDSPRRHDRNRDTPRPEKVVVVPVRTLTSALRVRELVNFVFNSDYRIRLVYVFDDGSAFCGWRTEWSVKQSRYIWQPSAVDDLEYDLVVSASENVDFHRWSGPIFVVPHGLGNHKAVPRSGAPGTVLSGLPAADVLRTGRVTLITTHPDQESHLHRTCPATIDHTVVVGDTSLAVLLASNEPRHVERYRESLRTGGRELILVMSTWGNDSVLGSVFGLLARLLAELPMDQYRVGLVAHCNVWTRDGADELLRKLERPLNAGLVLVDPEDWHSALLAAKVVVSDNGSLAMYAAMMGKPLLLASFSETEVVKDSPMAELGHVAARLDLQEPIPPQVRAAIAKVDPAYADYITRTVVAPKDRGVQQLRKLLYQALGLSLLWPEEEIGAAPPPRAIIREVHSCMVTTEYLDPNVVLSYSPWVGEERDITFGRVPKPYLVSSEKEPKPRIFNNASVIHRDTPFAAGMDAWLERHDGHGYKLAAMAIGPLSCEVHVGGLDRYAGQRFVLTSKTLGIDLRPTVLMALLAADNALDVHEVRDQRVVTGFKRKRHMVRIRRVM
jgi:hypothetical protein